MDFKRKFGRKKETKPTKGLLLVILLAAAIILWFKADAIMEALF
ncbi:MAG: hypothetical protein V3V28_03830 [Polaribacter sp.]